MQNIFNDNVQHEIKCIQQEVEPLRLNVVIMSEKAFLEKTFFKEHHVNQLYTGPFARIRMKAYVALVDLGVL